MRMSDQPSERPPARFRSRRRNLLALAILVLAAAGGYAVYATWAAHNDRGKPPETVAEGNQPLPAGRDTEQRRAVLGVWEDDYQGHRTMTLHEDGTGTMVVELSGLKAMLSAPRLRFDMEWSLEEGRLNKRTVGGEPATQVKLILKTMGDRVSEPILELTEERLVLLDQDGKTKYEWRRVQR